MHAPIDNCSITTVDTTGGQLVVRAGPLGGHRGPVMTPAPDRWRTGRRVEQRARLVDAHRVRAADPASVTARSTG